MINKGNPGSEDQNIREILGTFLQQKAKVSALTSNGRHLDEDSLSAFVEGSLNEREIEPIMTHLVDCGFCRKVTAELVRLDFALANDQRIPIPTKTDEPAPVSKVLNSILSRIFGSTEGVVFAHEERDDDESESDDNSTDK